MNAKELMAMKLAEPKWAVDALIPEGLTILAGRPKLGKSWLMLGVAIAVAAGGRALGQIEVAEGPVLYLALEDSWRRLQQRVGIQLVGAAGPEGLEFAREWPRGLPGVAELDAWLQGHPHARLIVIDTLAKFRAPTRRDRSYDTDYSDIAPLQQLALKYGVAIVVVHHLRKLGSDDWTDQISGTLGLAGAADGLLGLFRTRGEMQAELRVAGRDVEEQTLGLRFDPEICAWVLLGSADGTTDLSREDQGLLRDMSRVSRPQTARELADKLQKPYETIRKRLQRLADKGLVTSSPLGWTPSLQTVSRASRGEGTGGTQETREADETQAIEET